MDVEGEVQSVDIGVGEEFGGHFDGRFGRRICWYGRIGVVRYL